MFLEKGHNSDSPPATFVLKKVDGMQGLLPLRVARVTRASPCRLCGVESLITHRIICAACSMLTGQKTFCK